MKLPTRVVAVLLLSGAWTTAFLAQGGQTPPPAQQPPPPQPTPAQQPQQGGRRGGAGGFTQFTRPLASQDVIVRGKALYETNCASCHAVDLRGTADGKNPNLLRSGVALRDQKGELIGARVAKHTPPHHADRGRHGRDRGVHPQRSRDDGRSGQPAGTQPDERHAERARRRREDRRGDVRRRAAARATRSTGNLKGIAIEVLRSACAAERLGQRLDEHVRRRRGAAAAAVAATCRRR